MGGDQLNSLSDTIGAQQARNQTYSVLIRLLDPRSFGWGVPAWYFLFPFCSLFSLHMTLTNPVQPRALSEEGFFFVPMPCALEAQTVIKTFCLWLAIPTYWRIGEKESKVSAETKKQNKQNTATKHKQKDNDPRHLAIESETLRFQKYPLVSQYCTTTK